MCSASSSWFRKLTEAEPRTSTEFFPHQLFQVIPNLQECFNNSIETRRKSSFFVLERITRKTTHLFHFYTWITEFMPLDSLRLIPVPNQGVFWKSGTVNSFIFKHVKGCQRPLLLQAINEKTSLFSATLKSRYLSLVRPGPTSPSLSSLFGFILRIFPHLCWELIFWLHPSFTLFFVKMIRK